MHRKLLNFDCLIAYSFCFLFWTVAEEKTCKIEEKGKKKGGESGD